MKTRVVSGLIMVPLLFVIYFGGIWLWIAALAISLIGISEFCRGFENIDVKPSRIICYVMTIVLFLGSIPVRSSAVNDNVNIHIFISVWLPMVVMVSLVYGFKVTERGPYDVIATIASIVYIPLFAYHIVMLDATEYSRLTWIIVIAAFGSDIFAYFTGYLIGKHKMAPNLSPKKTIEGGIGGLVGSTILCGLFGYIFMRDMTTLCIILGLVGGVAAEAGDLSASAFKRHMGIKDYGDLIPGHGGVMDRFDSVLFVAPVVYGIVTAYTEILAV